ncbi:MAG: efflux RND transporter periplasmic adaptor subunit [Gammaproteobacteria bacterium]
MKKQIQPISRKLLLFVLLLMSAVLHAQTLEGTLSWANRTELSSAVSGIITRVDVVAGQKVKKDDILTQLSQAFFAAQYNKAKAARESEKEELEEAKRELDRAIELYERTVLAEHELQIAKNGHKKAVANYKKAQEDFVKARNDLGFSTIKAPFDAVVIKVLRKKNEIVNASIEAPLMVVIAEAGKMVAQTSISPSMLSDVKAGRTANVTVADKTYTGKVLSVGLEFIQGTNQYPLEVEFETGSSQLRSGMKATIDF